MDEKQSEQVREIGMEKKTRNGRRVHVFLVLIEKRKVDVLVLLSHLKHALPVTV